MELKWLEDFLHLAESGSFSRSADARHVSQSAFSRRIRSLEVWLGADLVDRSTYPTQLTPAGARFQQAARQMVARLQQARLEARGDADGEVLTVAAPHNLALNFYPRWLQQAAQAIAPAATRLFVGNVHDAVLALVAGSADVLLCYHHASHPVALDAARFVGLTLGTDDLFLYSAAQAGAPLHRLDKTPAAYLAYAPNAYFRRLTDGLLASATPTPRLEMRHETDMAEVIKAMVLAGHGIAFLPESAVSEEVAAGRLFALEPQRLTLCLDIRMFHDRDNLKPSLARLWRSFA